MAYIKQRDGKNIKRGNDHDIIPIGWKYLCTDEEFKEGRIVVPQPGLEEGVKFDKGKRRLELIHPYFNDALSEVMTMGAEKYGDWNWYKGMDWSRVYGALQRHLNAWYQGAKKDQESGKSHLWHAACCLMFLIVYEAKGIGKDDRP
jgi:hypothetical protein